MTSYPVRTKPKPQTLAARGDRPPYNAFLGVWLEAHDLERIDHLSRSLNMSRSDFVRLWVHSFRPDNQRLPSLKKVVDTARKSRQNRTLGH